mmetsp:Transcript_8653/g.39372  ORF Transcript_8653/g.39372 Transcript_8653/m.39372 type:complete len:206 (+) Transcript_8653:3535-4152(+)
MMRLLASTALVIVLCCALCDFAVTLISVTVKTPAQGRVAQRACFRISQSLLTLYRLGPTQVYDAAVFTSQALSAITSGSVTTTIFLSLSYILSVASRRKHGSPEAKKLVRLARALLNLASITWAFISLLRHIPGFCPVGQKKRLDRRRRFQRIPLGRTHHGWLYLFRFRFGQEGETTSRIHYAAQRYLFVMLRWGHVFLHTPRGR